MLDSKQQKDLMDWLIDNTACPTRIQGELAAFRHGLVVAVSALAQKVSIPETKEDDQ